MERRHCQEREISVTPSVSDHLEALRGKVVLVSGGAGGIGLAIAESFAELGAAVAIVDIAEDPLSSVEVSLTRAGHEVLAIAADVTREDDISACIGKIESEFGRLDVLVNNVGAALGLKPFADTTHAEWDQLYRVNLWHMFALTHAALPLLKRGGPGGSVINVSTIEAFRGFPWGAVYAAFKSGVTGFTQSLALELAPDGIRVNAIAPETTMTLSVDSSTWLPSDEQSRVSTWIPLGRFGAPADAASAAVFLASGMSSWVTGTTIHVDGGCLAAAGWLRSPTGTWTHRPTISGTRWPPSVETSPD
jgi:NAD(P)-dependent dehydrogenase (short-subunit alcohol dehydrogenase family)